MDKLVPMTQERRQDREREFHDALFAKEGEARSEAGRFYDVVGLSQRAYWAAVLARASSADCLEYGCAYGSSTIEVAGRAASATGIDISPVVVAKARQRAADQGVNAEFVVAEAESLDFDDNTFDLAFGNSVVHHLELRPAVAEMARVLRPSGSAVFAEPLGHNRLINRYRERTPGMRTPDEHPLVRGDFELFRQHFERVDIQFFHLTALAAAFLRAGRLRQTASRALDGLDRLLLRSRSPLAYQAWICVVTMERPITRAGA